MRYVCYNKYNFFPNVNRRFTNEIYEGTKT